MTKQLDEAVKEAIKDAIEEFHALSKKDISNIVNETLKQTFVKLGVNEENPFEMQKDFQFIRAWRESSEKVKNHGIMVALGIVVSTVLGLLFLGIKTAISSGFPIK